MATLLDLDALTFRYPEAPAAALREVGARVDDGLTAVAGPSGGGKSTLLRLSNGLVPHLSGGRIAGSARSCGLDVLRSGPRLLSRHVGFVFQDPELQSVRAGVDADVALALETTGLTRPEMRARVEEVLHAVGAAHLAGRRLNTLSGGERQRVAIAGALVSRPRLLVLDEPLSQLDPAGAAAVIEVCLRLRDSGTAILCAEHRLDELAAAADAALWVEAGRVTTVAPAALAVPSARPRRPTAVAGEVAWEIEAAALSPAPGAPPVLRDVRLCGNRGEVVALRGANGTGKTTLLRTLAGFVRPAGGAVTHVPGRAAYLPQNPAALLHRATVADEVATTLRRAGDGGDGAALLALLGLEGLAGRAPQDLSSGERQRAAIAAILAGRPAVALLDEPTRGMDDAARRGLVAAIDALAAQGTAVILATHDQRLCDAVADTVVELGDGTARTLHGRVLAGAAG